MRVYEFREKVVAVLRAAAALECRCDPPFSACVACQAAGVLREVAELGLRMQRWRNGLGTVVVTVHIAGQVWVSREYRRSCPGYIVDRRQACALCGIELARGKWNLFFDPGERVWIRPDPPRARARPRARSRRSPAAPRVAARPGLARIRHVFRS